jgi:hypothetical protein
MKPEIALQNLYNATRLAPLTAEQHEFLLKCAQSVAEALNTQPKDTENEHA